MLRSYTPADALTIVNATCGALCIFLCLDYIAAANRRLLWSAFLLLPLALLCDVLDGWVARLNPKRQSLLGADLDSLSDVISFGVAPAVLGFTLGLRGGWDRLCLTYFIVCGVSRLARFNVTAAALADSETGKVKYFEVRRSRQAFSSWRCSASLSSSDGSMMISGWRVPGRPCAAPSDRLDLCGQRQRDDQRDASCSEALKHWAWCPSF